MDAPFRNGLPMSLRWYVGLGGLLYLWPSFFFGWPIWEMGKHYPVLQAALAVTPLVAGVAFWWFAKQQRGRFASLMAWNAAVYGLVVLLFLLIPVSMPLLVLAITVVLAAGAQGVWFFLFSRRQRRTLVWLPYGMIVAALGLGATVAFNPGGVLQTWGPRGEASATTSTAPSVQVTTVESAHYLLQATHFENHIPQPTATGGGFVALGDTVLLVTGAGDVYWLQPDWENNRLAAMPLAITVPLNAKSFAQAAPPEARQQWFRVGGVAARTTKTGAQLFVTHHYWNDARERYHVRVSTITGTVEDWRAGTSTWHTLFETSPGLPFMEHNRYGNPFAGLQIGGRIQFLDDDHLLVTIGDHEFDGWNDETIPSQNRAVSYGKILKVNIHTGADQIYSLGHRNPQGLFIATDGTIWSTEHGPEGGDELNRIQEGANYGWPLVTFGTNYGDQTWPLSIQPGTHDGYARPFYSWNPSIGTSNLIEVKNNRFGIWSGDLVIASLREQSLYRLRIREERVLLVEPILIGARIRDLVEMPTGALLLWTDAGTIIGLRPLPASRTMQGPALFAQCSGCHTLTLDGAHRLGPNLHGVVGRQTASVPGFPYSTALQAMDALWTEERLDAFLQDPASFAPGTTMQMSGIADSVARHTLIAYLKAN